jgi:hypothetical protein
MAWVRLDDLFTDHPKIAAVGAIGAWLQVQALCYANRNLTDGFVPSGVAQSFLARGVIRDDDRGVRWTLGEHSGMQGADIKDVDWPAIMVAARLWEYAPGGFQIHDYLEYQPTKATILAERERHASRMKEYRIKRRGTVSDGTSDGVSDSATGAATATATDGASGSVSNSGPVPVPNPEERRTTELGHLARVKTKPTPLVDPRALSAARKLAKEGGG